MQATIHENHSGTFSIGMRGKCVVYLSHCCAVSHSNEKTHTQITVQRDRTFLFDQQLDFLFVVSKKLVPLNRKVEKREARREV